MAGRRPKPKAVKELAGNPGKRKLSDSEPVPHLGVPDCPEWLGDTARAEWFRIVPELQGMGTLATSDAMVLACYCQAVGELADLSRMMNTKKSRNREESNTIKDCQNQVRYLAAEFGLTPSSRSRVHVAKPKAKKDDKAKYFKVVGGA